MGTVQVILASTPRLNAEAAAALAAVVLRHAAPLSASLKFGALLLAVLSKFPAEVRTYKGGSLAVGTFALF
jgi:hypothetical protein